MHARITYIFIYLYMLYIATSGQIIESVPN
jgi:hypothetical protein